MKFEIGDRVTIINKDIDHIIEGFKQDEDAYPRLKNYKTTNNGVIIKVFKGIDQPVYALDIDDGFLAWLESELEEL